MCHAQPTLAYLAVTRSFKKAKMDVFHTLPKAFPTSRFLHFFQASLTIHAKEENSYDPWRPKEIIFGIF